MARPLHPKAFLAWRRASARLAGGVTWRSGWSWWGWGTWAARCWPASRPLAGALGGSPERGGGGRGSAVCPVPGWGPLAGKPPSTAAEVWAALEEGEADVTPGLVYAAAAAQAGCGFVAAARDAALQAPGV